jgi:hypothetical protein
MKRIRMAGLCLVAVFAVSAVVAASASAALPEFSGPFPKPFTSKSGKVYVETVGKLRTTCTAGTNGGKVTGPKTGIVTIRFTGCKALSYTCTTKGAAVGEIVSNLRSTLGYINKAKKEVGIALESATGAPFAEFTCGPANVVGTGSAIGKLTPINKRVKAGKPFILKFTQANGKQRPTKLEGGPTDVLVASIGGVSQEAGLSGTDEVLVEGGAEIKA